MKGVLAYTMKDMNEERKKQNISSNINVSNYKDSETEKMLQRIKKFRLLDDDFMIVCFENNIEATELVLSIILEKPDIIVKTVFGGASINNNINSLKGGCDILVGTPGRIADLVQRKIINVSKVKYFVVDECR